MSQSNGDLESEFDLDELPESVDRAAVERMRIVAKVLDDSIRLPGTDYRIGLDPILGVLPGAGDAIGAALSTYIVLEAARLGVSYATLLRMIANVAIDVGGGLVPYVGTVIDAAWKANKRNLELVIDDLVEDGGDDGTETDEGVEIEVTRPE